jgi:hypothetical protein
LDRPISCMGLVFLDLVWKCENVHVNNLFFGVDLLSLF